MKHTKLIALLFAISALQAQAGGSTEPTAVPVPTATAESHGCNACMIIGGIISGIAVAYGIAGLVAAEHYHEHDQDCCSAKLFCNNTFSFPERRQEVQINIPFTCNAQGPGEFQFCIENRDHKKEPKWTWPVAITAGVALGAGSIALLGAIVKGSMGCCGAQVQATAAQ
ncbi:MAG: hypothetical protein V4534_04930 [Myxococcota bacterium]